MIVDEQNALDAYCWRISGIKKKSYDKYLAHLIFEASLGSRLFIGLLHFYVYTAFVEYVN